MVFEDLFVKLEFRRAHLGTRLLQRIEQISCLEKPFSELNHEILVPITKPDAGPTRYNAVRGFFMTSGYLWKNTPRLLAEESHSKSMSTELVKFETTESKCVRSHRTRRLQEDDF
jgi:hypothetical protein